MALYRYRTCVLAGPWRSSRAEAVRDARRAGQADPRRVDRLSWRVPGEIEKKEEADDPVVTAAGPR